jgi:excisionase family DNA binding protein
MATFTAGQAARRLGVSKPTISKYLKEGRIAGARMPDGSFSIDGAELARFEASRHISPKGQKVEETKADDVVEVAVLRVELANARERIDDLTRREAEAREQAAEALARERAQADRVAALIEDKSNRPGLFARVFGLTGR